jgi:hypothetical protein
MYSSQDLSLHLPLNPNDIPDVIASFDLCNYQHLPVLDNIIFGPDDGDLGSLELSLQQQPDEQLDHLSLQGRDWPIYCTFKLIYNV